MCTHQGDYNCIFPPIILAAVREGHRAISHALARFRRSQNCPKISLKTLFLSHIWPITAQIIAPAVL